MSYHTSHTMAVQGGRDDWNRHSEWEENKYILIVTPITRKLSERTLS